MSSLHRRLGGLCLALLFLAAAQADPANTVVLDINSRAQHPRNSEGAFFQPLLRLPDGKLAMIYDVTEAGITVCRPYLQVSADEGATWSAPAGLISMPGWFVLNNDRVLQTGQGRLVVPLAYHRLISTPQPNGATFNAGPGTTLWYLSDGHGRTWREAETEWNMPVASQAGLQEPGVEELADGTLFSWARTDQGAQYAMRSYDGGETHLGSLRIRRVSLRWLFDDNP